MESELVVVLVSSAITLIASLALAAYRSRLEIKRVIHTLEENYTNN